MDHVRIFISAVSGEFRAYRDSCAAALKRPNVSVHVQEDFAAHGGGTLEKLDDTIRQSEAMVHLVGDSTGWRVAPEDVAAMHRRYPDLAVKLAPIAAALTPEAPPLPATQWEAYLALYHAKPLIVAVPAADAPREPGWHHDPAEMAEQQAHLARLAACNRYPQIIFSDAPHLAIEILRSQLQEILDRARPPLLRQGLRRVSGWMYLFAAVPPLAADIVKPALPHCNFVVLALAAVAVLVLALAIRRGVVARETGASLVVLSGALALYTLAILGLQGFGGGASRGVVAEAIPGIGRFQEWAGLVDKKLADIKEDTSAIRTAQSEEAARAEAFRAEQQQREQQTQRSIDKLERLQLAAAGGGASSVRAIEEIRALLRAGAPEIDNIAPEQVPSVVKRIIEDLQKPTAQPGDFAGAVQRALAEAQQRTAKLDFAGAAQSLDAALAKADAEDQDRARGRAVLLAERGRVAGLQLQYRDAAGFYRKAAETVAFDGREAWRYRRQAAGALYHLGDEFGDNPALIDAIAEIRIALALAPRDRAPLDWATTQNNLGMALRVLGERDSGTAHLDEAVAAYRAALLEQTRKRVPLAWALTQNNLGTALARLGERETGTARLDEAVAAYRDALLEYTRERAPLAWAMTQNNLGLALWALGERETGTARLNEAIAAFRDALLERTRERGPLAWATTQNNLGLALQRLGERESSTARLNEAIAAFRDALLERTRERVPLDWAQTQNNLGNALRRLGERKSDTAQLYEAVAAYRTALLERTRERVPLDWAQTHNNLGLALRQLGEREDNVARLEEAVAAFDAALSVFVTAGADYYIGGTRRNRERAAALLAARRGQ